MSLRDYAGEKKAEQKDAKYDWKLKADIAVEKFRIFFMNYMKRRIDGADKLQKGSGYRLSTDYESNCIAAVPLIIIRYDKKATSYNKDYPYFDKKIDTSSELRNSMNIQVNNQEEADYCLERIKKMFLNEGIKIDKCDSYRSGILFKSPWGGYIIWYSLEW